MVRVEVYLLAVSQSEQLDRWTRTMVRVEVYWLTTSQLEQLDPEQAQWHVLRFTSSLCPS